MLDTTQDPTFQMFFPELLGRNEKPLTNLVSYLSKQDLKRAELEQTFKCCSCISMQSMVTVSPELLGPETKREQGG